MRTATLLLVITLVAFAPTLAVAAEIPQGAHMLLRMENSVSTRTARGGDYVYLRTASPISIGGQIVVPVGSYVQGVVTQAKRSAVAPEEPSWRSGWRR